MRIMAVDLGLARTGLAISDDSGFLASPIGTIAEKNLKTLSEQVTAAAREYQAGEIVVGHPRNMDGTRGESARRAEVFAEDLRIKTGLPVRLWDERMTTMSAIGYLNQNDVRGKKRKAVVDTVSAVIILQNYLDSLS